MNIQQDARRTREEYYGPTVEEHHTEKERNSTPDEGMHVLLGYSHKTRTTMLAPFPTEATDRSLDELSSELLSTTELGLYMKPVTVEGIYDDLQTVIKVMDRHWGDWDDEIAILEQFVE